MKTIFVALALAGSTTAAVAQTAAKNIFQKWDTTTEFTSRAVLGPNPGLISQAFDHGFAAGLKTLTESQYIIQDQNLGTREPWHVGTTGLDSNGLPDYAGLSAYATNNLLPPGTGIGAFLITHSGLGTSPHKVKRTLHESFHHTWHLLRGANWTADGISIHMSQAAAYNGTLLCSGGLHREIPRTEGTAQILEDLGWSSTPTPPNSDPAPRDRAWRLRMNFAEVTLNGASVNAAYNNSPCPNPNEGYASLDPDFNDKGAGTPARYDGYRWSVSAGTKFANGVVALFWSQLVVAPAVPTPFGDLHLDPQSVLFLLSPVLIPLNSQGAGSLTMGLGPGPSPLRAAAESVGSWSAQAAAVNAKLDIELSNLFSFQTCLTPPGFTANPQGMTPNYFARPTSANRFHVVTTARVFVEFQDVNGKNLGLKQEVPARTMRVLRAPPGTVRACVTSGRKRVRHSAVQWTP